MISNQHRNATTILGRLFIAALFSAAPNSGAQQINPPSPDAPATWCGDGQSEYLSFQLGENGKTASICEQDGVLTYAFGHLDGEPELRYSGKEIAGFRFPGVNVGFGEMNEPGIPGGRHPRGCQRAALALEPGCPGIGRTDR